VYKPIDVWSFEKENPFFSEANASSFNVWAGYPG